MAVAEAYINPVAQRSSVETLVDALAHVRPLHGLREQDYRWLAERGTEVRAQVGDQLFRQGDPTDFMTILLEGEIQVRRHIGAHTEVFVGRAGEITGVLPFSRMKTFGGDGSVVQDVWALMYDRSIFDDMVQTIPGFGAIIAAILLDRVREVTRMEQQAEKLLALNKLSGNLAHELNNPASAAQRSAMQLLPELRRYGRAKFALGAISLPADKLNALHLWEKSLPESQAAPDSLADSDRETAIQRWLASRDVELEEADVQTLSESGLTPELLDTIPVADSPRETQTYLTQFALARRTQQMTNAVLDSTHRIFRIIDAIKDYAYLDQAPLQQVSIEHAIRNTLAMLQARLAKVELVLSFAPGLPAISAFGSELNQVWMALLENALDAIHDEGRLEIRARTEAEWMIVEIIDNGPGIPAEMRDKIFEPFFTTKPIGAGLGLGLDTATRIVRKHRGIIQVHEVAEGTCFQVRLPLEQWRAY